MPDTPYGKPGEPCCTGEAEQRNSQKVQQKDEAFRTAMSNNLGNNGARQESSLMRSLNKDVIGTVAHSTRNHQR